MSIVVIITVSGLPENINYCLVGCLNQVDYALSGADLQPKNPYSTSWIRELLLQYKTNSHSV